MDRLLIVSNRLPVTVQVTKGATDDDGLRVVPSPGGLATGLRGPHEASGGLWIGWPGEVEGDEQRARLDTKLEALRCAPVHLTKEEVARYYDSFSNGVLWPLFHYLLERIPTESQDWEAYRAVNEKFADVVASHHRAGDRIWVQDYQLLLLPGLLRQRIPEARIGFFLHIPFPSTEVFRTLPWRSEIVEGLLGADVIGFHTFSYLRHFTTATLQLLGVEANVDRVVYDGREIRLGAYPMGIDVESFATLATSAPVLEEVARIERDAGEQAILLGVDRLDYTKGIPRRLLAFEQLLEREKSLRCKVRLVQVAVPSRTNVEAYAGFRRSVDEIVGRINGKYGSMTWTPIQYLYRSLTAEQLVAFYKAADVMLVTPLRDGMNLVAKEFVACRDDEDGVLVLSEFAGAAAELGEALLVNPYDVEHAAVTIRQALTMPEAERKTRMKALRARVKAYDVHRWVESFLRDLDAPREEGAPPATQEGAAKLTMALVPQAMRASEVVLLLDYDGTLVPFADTPEMAQPDPDLFVLLRDLTKRRNFRVHIVSGRARQELEAWFGDLPLWLHAEHGFWSREPRGGAGAGSGAAGARSANEPGGVRESGGGGNGWVPLSDLPGEWKPQARHIFEAFASRVPGALVEEKTASIAWHYRLADREYGSIQAKELLIHLANVFSNAPVEVLKGDKVIEVRPHGVNKGIVARVALASARPDACVVALGDDRTDEDLFAALPESAFTVHVGRKVTRARYRLRGPAAARELLRALLHR